MFSNYNEMRSYFVNHIAEQLRDKYGLSLETLLSWAFLRHYFNVSSHMVPQELGKNYLLLDVTNISFKHSKSPEYLLAKEYIESNGNPKELIHGCFVRLDYESPFTLVKKIENVNDDYMLSMIISHKDESGEITYYSLSYTYDSSSGHIDRNYIKAVSPTEKVLTVYE